MKTAITILCVLCAVLLSKAQNIKQAEYFIDKDKGVGKNTKINLPASADSNYSFTIDLSGISAGVHKLYIRTKDTNEKWSLTARKNIEITPSFDQPGIITGEYFFDSDPGYNKANQITISPDSTEITQSFATATSELKNGYHKLYSRFKDSLGKWSITSRRSIEVIRTADTIKIVEAEYFFTSDKGYGKAFEKVFSDSSADGKFKFKIPYNKIPADGDTLFVRVKDSLGNWSLTKLDTFTVGSFANTLVNSENKISNNNGMKTLVLFPNPATKLTNINYQMQSKSASVQIFDVNGKPVMQLMITNGNSTIDVSKLTPGTYLLQLKDGEAIQTAKFIKQ